MTRLLDMIAGGKTVAHHKPWRRAVIDARSWRTASWEISGGAWSLLGLWGDDNAVHIAARDNESDVFGILSLACPDGTFPSIAQVHPPAARLERSISDLFGKKAINSPDTRPWLDHGKWGVHHPLGRNPSAPFSEIPYAFLSATGESLHQIPVGPVHAGIIEPGFFLFTASGETVVRLEERLGYVHKGVESLMAGATLDRAQMLAGRVSGDSTLAYGLGFALAAEAALGVEPPPRAQFLRGLMAELERIANHLGDFGAICNDASFVIMHAQCGILRERVLRASDAVFGHRLMRDCIVTGGVRKDFSQSGVDVLNALIGELANQLPGLIELYDKTASLLDRTVGTGILAPALARQYACGGFVGRASGRDFDARRTPGYAPYDRLHFTVPVLAEGDVNARVWIRIREIEQSLSMIRLILALLPNGDIQVPVDAAPGEEREGVALVEGFRGDILVWLRLGSDGVVRRCHLRDPSWFQWPLLEAAIEGNIVADFPLCNKSFNCSYSGHDL